MPGPMGGPGGPAYPRAGISGGEPVVPAAAPLTATTNFPELHIEWLPDGKPNDSDGTWVSLVPYIAEGATKRGRQYELDRFVAGTAPLTLKSTTRLFDPNYAAGTYYGKLRPMKQLRVTATWAGVTYPVWRGYVTSWGTTVQDDKLFVTTLATKDGFERLERVKAPSSAWAAEVAKDSPTCWLRLGETDTSRVTDSSAGGNYGVYDNCQQGAESLVVNDSDGAVAFAHSLEERVVIQNPSLLTGYPFTISFLFKIDNSNPDGFKTIFVGHPSLPASTYGYIHVYMPSTSLTVQEGGIAVEISDGTNKRFTGTTARYTDNVAHHCAIVCASASSSTIYIDGVAVSIGIGTTGTGAPAFLSVAPSNWTIGNFPDLQAGDYGFGTNDTAAATTDNPFPVKERGTIDEFVVWNGTAVSSARIAAHAAATTGWDGDDTGARVTRFLDAIGWSADLRDIDTGISILGPSSWSTGASALSIMQGWADTELAQFFMGKDGKVVWWSRHRPLLEPRSTRPQATFGDAHSGEVLQYDNNGFQAPVDETQIRNPVMASRKNGVSYTASDDDLIDNVYGDRTWSAPGTEDQKDSVVRDRATWILNRYKNEATRLAELTITPQRDPLNLWPVVLGLEIGDRIRVKRTPAGMGAQIVLDFIIEGIEHKFSAKALWKTTFTGSPVDPNVGSYLILDDDTYGLLDSGLLAY